MIKLPSALLVSSLLFIFGKTQNYTSSCTLPNHPSNGRWIYSRDFAAKPSDQVIITSTITFECDENYKLYPNDASSRKMCTGGWGILPICKKHCPTLHSSGNMIIVCVSPNKKGVSCNKPYEGTLATIKCPSINCIFYIHCNGNNWDSTLPSCQLDCGLKSVEPTRLIVGGSKTFGYLPPSQTLEYPWQVGIYTRSKHVCSGALISAELVLTSAGCFETNDPEKYIVAVGKNSKEYLDPQSQHVKILEIIFHKSWDNNDHDSNNIAIVVLHNVLQFSKHVRPVCLDYGEKFRPDYLITEIGFVTGWAYKNSIYEQSEELDELKVQFSNLSVCKPNSSHSSNVPDKICATLLDEKICKIDKGAPLIILEEDRYYLRGIAISLNKNFCDSSGDNLYTSVRYHIKFIKDIYLKYNIG